MHANTSSYVGKKFKERQKSSFPDNDNLPTLFSLNSSCSSAPNPYLQSQHPVMFDTRIIETNHRIENVVFKILRVKASLNNLPEKGEPSGFDDDRNLDKDFREVPTQDALLQILSNRLAMSKNYQVVTAAKSRNRYFPEVSLDELLQEEEYLKNVSLEQLSDIKLLQLSSTRKSQSIALQNYILKCSQEDTEILCKNLTKNSIAKMIIHQFGNYTVQELVKKSIPFRKRVEEYCQEDFYILADTEYSSRVMQILIEESDSFRFFAFSCCEANLGRMVERISSVFLITSCIRSAKSEKEYNFMVKELSNNVRPWVSKKYFKRIIVSILQSCNPPTLQLVYNLLELENNILKFFEDKYSSYVVLTFVERGHQPTIQLLAYIIQQDVISLLEAEYFRFFINRLCKFKGESIFRELFHVLSGNEFLDSILARARKQKGRYFAYLLALSAEPKQYASLNSFWKVLLDRLAV